MSLVVQSLSSGNALTATGTGTATTKMVGTSSALPFAQALVHTMAGNTANTASVTAEPTLSNLASLFQGLLNQVQTSSEKTGDKATDANAVLEQLTDHMSQLDESLDNDPALFAALQGWLLQVSILLTGTDGAVESESTDGTGSLSPLAQNAETLRFAVQDDLNSLVSLIKETSVQGKEETASKGVALLNNFTALLAQTTVNGNKNKVNPSNVATESSIALSQLEQSEGEPKEKVVMNSNNRSLEINALKTEVVINPSTQSTNVAGTTKAELTNTTVAKAAVAGDTNRSDSLLEGAPETASETPLQGDHEVVTAGQLSLRGGITAPLKAEVPVTPVPVQQFAQEMSGLITGKLEFVQKGGIAEATISLFPENLGQVDVKITMQNGHLVAQFMTEHSGAKDLLEQQMNQLRAALQSQGLQVEKLEVTQNNTPLNSQWGQEGRQSSSGGQQGRRSKQSHEDASDAVLTAELNGEWKDWVTNGGQEDENQAGSFSAQA